MNNGSIPRLTGGYIERPNPSGLADVIEIILDKGLVIDAYVRVSLIGIEILTIDARIVIASVDTYLRFAEAVERLDLQRSDKSQGLPELMEGMTESGAKSKTKGALEGAKEKVGIGGDDDDDGDEEAAQPQPQASGLIPSSSRRRAAAGTTMSEVHVYGVVPRPSRFEIRRDGVRLIVHRDVAALVRDLEARQLRGLEGTAQQWRVLEEAVEHTTVLPVRFGTMMESEERRRASSSRRATTSSSRGSPSWTAWCSSP